MTPVIFFDLDGVLADFMSAALRVHGSEIPMDQIGWDFPTQMGFRDSHDPKFWNRLGYEFWEDLPIYDDGHQLLCEAEGMVGSTNIAFLTAPCSTDGCAQGKIDWVRKHFPKYRRQLFIGAAKHMYASPTKILVDDHDLNVKSFVEAGGHAVLVPRPWSQARDNCVQGHKFDVQQVAGWLREAVERARRAVDRARG